MSYDLHGTTICAVKRDGKIVMCGDGQVTLANAIVLKNNATKVRRIYNGEVVVGFAGATADAFALSNRFEEMLQKYAGNLMRASVELASLWRMDKMYRNLEAMMIVSNRTTMLLLSGNGDVIEPDGDAIAIGSGGNYALAAAKALLKNTGMNAKQIAMESLKIAGEICVFTNNHLTVEEV